MKKNTTKFAVLFIVVVLGIVGVYAYLSTKQRQTLAESQMTETQRVLARDLDKDYPPTVKQVVSYFTEIQECFYNEDCSDEEIEQLGVQARKLFDEELQEANEMASYLLRLQADISSFKSKKLRIWRITLASSNNVETFKEDGFEFARIHCSYFFAEESGKVSSQEYVYLLRRDKNRNWKIYGWDMAEAAPESAE